ncbi:unnamed protein product [Prorocentrum cordatum]|uniref:Uncharacterized protein n=1 Tax=Prorocentrum cordatum TaxID=2364126 RepID=A0ABN9W3G6_9DINO|nr:unnamed protein product [Polarella glacialis]
MAAPPPGAAHGATPGRAAQHPRQLLLQVQRAAPGALRPGGAAGFRCCWPPCAGEPLDDATAALVHLVSSHRGQLRRAVPSLLAGDVDALLSQVASQLGEQATPAGIEAVRALAGDDAGAARRLLIAALECGPLTPETVAAAAREQKIALARAPRPCQAPVAACCACCPLVEGHATGWPHAAEQISGEGRAEPSELVDVRLRGLRIRVSAASREAQVAGGRQRAARPCARKPPRSVGNPVVNLADAGAAPGLCLRPLAASGPRAAGNAPAASPPWRCWPSPGLRRPAAAHRASCHGHHWPQALGRRLASARGGRAWLVLVHHQARPGLGTRWHAAAGPGGLHAWTRRFGACAAACTAVSADARLAPPALDPGCHGAAGAAWQAALLWVGWAAALRWSPPSLRSMWFLDPIGARLQMLVRQLNLLGTLDDDTFVFIDYMCLPQHTRSDQIWSNQKLEQSDKGFRAAHSTDKGDAAVVAKLIEQILARNPRP